MFQNFTKIVFKRHGAWHVPPTAPKPSAQILFHEVQVLLLHATVAGPKAVRELNGDTPFLHLRAVWLHKQRLL